MNRDIARKLRKNLTDTESFVWKRLRYRQVGGFKFRRQHPLGSFIVDFVCLERKLVLELDGGQHAEHTVADAARSHWLEQEGYRVVRFWNHQPFQEWDVIEQELWRLLTEEGSTPHPNPPPQGGRGPEFGGGHGDG